MIVDFIITSNCNKAIDAYRKMKFTISSDKQYQAHFLSLTLKEQQEIMYNMLLVQAEVTRDNIKACKSTTIAGFGTFKYREGKARATVFRDKLANQYGFLSFRDVDNEALRTKIINKVNVIKREIFTSEHIERIKLGRSYSNTKVYTSFYFKRKKE
jgi:hypothetical protein